MKRLCIFAGAYRLTPKKVFIGFLSIGIVSVCFALPQLAFADTTESAQSVGVPTAVADPRSLSQESDSFMTGESPVMDQKNESVRQGWRIVQMRVTAYCPCEKCCGKFADGITACNHRIQDGDRFVAADKRYAFGTEMLIPGYNYSVPVEVRDRGGAIQGDRLDVFFNTHQEALEWGVQTLDILIKDS